MSRIEISIEKAQPQHVDEVVSIIKSVLKHQDDIGEPRSFGTERQVEVTESVAAGETFIVRADNRIVGSFAIHAPEPEIWPEFNDECTQLSRLVVAPNAQNQGIASKCLGFVEEMARRSPGKKLRFHCVYDQESSIDWYERRGYKQVGAIKLPHWRRASVRFEKDLSSSDGTTVKQHEQ